jgi:hypothetical protein
MVLLFLSLLRLLSFTNQGWGFTVRPENGGDALFRLSHTNQQENFKNLIVLTACDGVVVVVVVVVNHYYFSYNTVPLLTIEE